MEGREARTAAYQWTWAEQRSMAGLSKGCVGHQSWPYGDDVEGDDDEKRRSTSMAGVGIGILNATMT